MTREEAIKELQESHDMMRSYNIDESESRLMTALNMAIQALSQEPCDTYTEGYFKGYDDGLEQKLEEPCDDAISREAVLDIVCGTYEKDGWGESNFYKAIKKLPSVTQKSGKWVRIITEHKCYARDDTYTTTEYKCSECGAEPLALCANYESDYAFSNFCPNCGAKMESEDKE